MGLITPIGGTVRARRETFHLSHGSITHLQDPRESSTEDSQPRGWGCNFELWNSMSSGHSWERPRGGDLGEALETQ